MVAASTVDMEDTVDDTDTLLFRRLDKHCGSGVTEERAGRTVFVVDHRRHLFGSDDDDFFIHARAHVGGGVLQGNDKAGASGLDIIAIAVFESTAFGNNQCRRGKAVVRV